MVRTFDACAFYFFASIAHTPSKKITRFIQYLVTPMNEAICDFIAWTARQRDRFLRPDLSLYHPPVRNANYDACVVYQKQCGTRASKVHRTCSPWLSVPDPDPKTCADPRFARDFRRRVSLRRLGGGRVAARLDKCPLGHATAEGPLLEVAEKMYRAVPERWPMGPATVPTADDKRRCGRLALEEIKRHGMIDEEEQAKITKHMVEKGLIH